MDYMFINKPEFAEPIRVIFLCGVKFKDNETDKRIVLKNYLENDPKNKVLILEKYFDFAFKNDSNTGLLSYYDAELFNLHNIESFAALVATNVLVVHESLSTAGELGVFGSNEALRDRIITLVPDQFSVEEEKLSSFLRLAFWNKKDRLINNNVIRFYPITNRSMVSEMHSFYETSFDDNRLPPSIARRIKSQLIKHPCSKVLAINAENIKNEKQSIGIWLSCDSIKNYLLAILSISEIRKKLRSCKKVYEIRNILSNVFVDTLKNTYSSISGEPPKTIAVHIEKQPGLTFDNAISFMMYFCHACGIMKITCNDDDTISVSFSKDLGLLWKEYSKLINPISFAKWGE